jgi:hypothetical protein
MMNITDILQLVSRLVTLAIQAAEMLGSNSEAETLNTGEEKHELARSTVLTQLDNAGVPVYRNKDMAKLKKAVSESYIDEEIVKQVAAGKQVIS